MYIICGRSQYDYELKNIIFGVYDDKKQAEEDLNTLEILKEDEFELYIVYYEKNKILENNLFYLKN